MITHPWHMEFELSGVGFSFYASWHGPGCVSARLDMSFSKRCVQYLVFVCRLPGHPVTSLIA